MRTGWTVKPWERVTLSILGLIAAMVLIVVVAGYREATRPVAVARYDLALLPPGARPLRIALLSDTHLGGFASALDARSLGAIAERIRDEKPDVIVLAGDFIRGDKTLEEGLAPLSTLAAPYGVVAVPGNHDYAEGVDAARIARAMRKAGMAPLINDHVDVGPVVIAGLDDLWKGSSDIGEVKRALLAAGGRPVILVSHNPDVLPQVPKDVTLTLAGHTHGAMVMVPGIGPVMSSSRFGQRYRRGIVREDGRTMVVTSGAGGLAMRIGVPPEIAMVTLTPRKPG